MTALQEHSPAAPQELIEEARRRARHRRRRGAASIVAVLVAMGLCLLITHGAGLTGSGGAGGPPAPGSAATPRADVIAFARASSDGLDARIEIASVSDRGGRAVTLTDAWKDRMIASEPAWSPAGSRIAFVMSPRGHLTRYAGDGNIYVMNANGTHIRKLTHGLAASNPAWSPHGSRIAFIDGQGQALAVIDADGSHQHIIAHRRGYYEAPAWSPDGRSIAYDSGPDWSAHAIYTIRPNGTGEHRLTPTLGPADGGPAWSPNGARMAYSYHNAIWTMSATGAHRRRITTCESPCISDTQPAWSPSGRQLVFVRDSRTRYSNRYRLDAVRLTTGDVRQLTPKLRSATSPDWRP